jgi:hypothetical protein
MKLVLFSNGKATAESATPRSFKAPFARASREDADWVAWVFFKMEQGE